MGFFRKLFGKKVEKPSAETVQQSEERKEEVLKEEAKNITLEDVEKEVKDLDAFEPGEKPEPKKQTIEPVEAPKEEKPQPKEAPKTDNPVYHIKKHDKGWQIIADGAEKATCVFPNQKEAIDHAKENNMEYLLYRVDGTLRK